MTGVLHITDTLDLGGYERVAVNLANELPRERYRASLCTTRRDGPLEGWVAGDVARLRLARRRSLEWRAIRELAGFIRAHGIRILHAHGPSLFLARMAAALPPYPAVIWHAHSGKLAAQDSPAWPYRMGALGIAGVIAVNQPLLEWARRRLPVPAWRTWYLPNLAAEPEPGIAAPDLPGVPGARIAAVANLRPEKDHATLLRAFALVVRRVPQAHLLLVGAAADAEYDSRLRAQAAAQGLNDNVSFLGRRTDVPAILRACDIGVLSSAFEGLAMSLLEYGMANLAVVATTAGESAEVLDQGRFGALAPPRSPEALAAGLVTFLESPARRAEAGAAFGRHVRTRYGARAVMAQLCDIYDAVLGRERQGPVGAAIRSPQCES